MKTITANISAKTIKSSTGKVFNYPARTEIYSQDDVGQWTGAYGLMTEVDVIDVCKKSANWKEIRIAHFPMLGFHN